VRLSEFLDDGLEGALLMMGQRSRSVRVVISLMIDGLLLANFGWTAAGAWLAVNVALEAWLQFNQIRYGHGKGQYASALTRLSTVSAFSGVWSTMAALTWIHGSPAMKFTALIVLFGLLIEALKYAVLSRAAFTALAPFPVIALVGAPILFGGFRGWELVFAIVALTGLGAYLTNAARLMRDNARALERAQAQALEASRAKSAFLAMMSHELRTPMNGVMGMAHALASTRLDPRQTGYLDTIVQSGDGLMAILNDILDLSKIEAGKLELDAVSFDIGELGRQLHRLWEETARAKGLDLTLEIAPDLPAWVAGDPVRVRQVMLNLVANALKFTEHGGVRLAIDPDGERGVAITVSDTGVGISPEQQARLFQPFSQGDASITRRFGGTGLGLSICRYLVEMMDGEISLVSQPGVGSTFRATLPLAAAPAPTSGLALVPPPAEGLEGRRILVVDDNRTNQIVARAILEAAGAVVDVADDGRHALERLGGEAFDLVLMDVHMPRMDGVEALARIRAGEGGRRDIPVIALTADGMSGEAERLLARGFDAVQSKPIRPADLLQAVAEGCEGARAEVRAPPLRAQAS
jgi:signal transduction histidine kinase/ActR/RegA family two-component response regulator